jgi:hypothetical protein
MEIGCPSAYNTGQRANMLKDNCKQPRSCIPPHQCITSIRKCTSAGRDDDGKSPTLPAPMQFRTASAFGCCWSVHMSPQDPTSRASCANHQAARSSCCHLLLVIQVPILLTILLIGCSARTETCDHKWSNHLSTHSTPQRCHKHSRDCWLAAAGSPNAGTHYAKATVCCCCCCGPRLSCC